MPIFTSPPPHTTVALEPEEGRNDKQKSRAMSLPLQAAPSVGGKAGRGEDKYQVGYMFDVLN